LDEKLKIRVLFEISQVDKLLNDSKPLLDLCKLKTPDFIEISAAAMLLHSFYNGIENILRLIIKFYDTKLPNDIKWHMELLEFARGLFPCPRGAGGWLKPTLRYTPW